MRIKKENLGSEGNLKRKNYRFGRENYLPDRRRWELRKRGGAEQA